MRWTIVMVAIVKNEAPYIVEWIVYHMSLGVDHFMIYDNGSDDGTADKLTKFINSGRITLIGWPMRGGQIDAYNHALKLLQNNTEWIGYLDIDEFVVLHQHNDLMSYLTQMDSDEVLLPWRNFPYCGHLSRPGGTQLENYFWALRVPSGGVTQVKHFVRAAAVERVTAHFSFVRGGRVKLASGEPHSITHAISNPSFLGAQINHYATRSLAENQERMRKGQVSGSSHKRMDEFSPLTEAASLRLDFDDSVLRHFGAFKAAAVEWALVADQPHRFGLRQTGRQLSSFTHLIFYAVKSFCNYLLNAQHIHATTAIKVLQRTVAGTMRDINSILHDYSGKALHFAVETHSYLRYFQGTIHYGDFVRRYGFDCLIAQREVQIAPSWSAPMTAFGNGLFALVDLLAEAETSLELLVNGGESLVLERPPGGHNCIVFYVPMRLTGGTSVIFKITGNALAHEIIVGVLP